MSTVIGALVFQIIVTIRKKNPALVVFLAVFCFPKLDKKSKNVIIDYIICRLVELVDAEKKIKNEAVERALVAEKKLSDKKAFYRIVRNWWSEFNQELGKLTNQPVELPYRWPTDIEIEEEREKREHDENQILLIFGEKLRSKNDFTFQCIKKVVEKVDDGALRTLTEETVQKNRELNAELEKVENDLDEKTELCEDLRHKCEQLTKRNARLIGQMGTRAASSIPKTEQPEIKAEPELKTHIKVYNSTVGYV